MNLLFCPAGLLLQVAAAMHQWSPEKTQCWLVGGCRVVGGGGRNRMVRVRNRMDTGVGREVQPGPEP